MDKFDLVVIGSGPGGYVAAIRAAQLGLKVACIEKEKTLGGTCLNVGCIPSKALLHSSEHYDKLRKEGKEHGIECQGLAVNLGQMMRRKEKVVAGLVEGVAFLFKKNKVVRFEGEAKLVSPTEIAVGEKRLEAKNIILATGSEPIPLPFLPFDEERVVSSTGALVLPKIPKKLVVVGAGVIGLELGSVYRRLGSEVTFVELLDRVCPAFDQEISKNTQAILSRQGLHFHLSTKVLEGKREGEGIVLTVQPAQGEKSELRADVVLVAIGRRPFSKNLGLEALGIEKDSAGRVKVNSNFQTRYPSVFAIGDLIDGPMLAHKASEEGIAAAEIIAGGQPHVNYLAIPNVMYTWPEVAAVGMSEEEASVSGIQVTVGKFPFKANARARCSGDGEGLVKILAKKEGGQILGLHIIGPNASEMIGEGVLAIEKRMTLLELGASSHAHPTCSEAIKEAALAALKRAIHY